MLNLADLPSYIDALKALLLAQQHIVAGLTEQLNTRAVEIEHLKLQIAKLRCMQFGRKSEKLDHQIEQLELQLEDLQADEGEAAREMPAADQAPRKKSVRRPLPDHLPRDEKMYPPPGNACPACGGGLRPLGEDVAEQLEWKPGSFRVIRHVRPKLACTCCDTIVQVHAPSRPIARGIAGPGLLAHVLASAKLHADDTPIPVLAPGHGKTKTARLWTYVRDDSASGDTTPAAVWFAYTPDRKGIHPQAHLAIFKGVLQADAYAGFNALYVDGTIEEAACRAHARRKFHDLHAARPSAITTEALRRIAALYVIEAELRGKPPHERQQVRQQRSRPLLDDFGSWLRHVLAHIADHPVNRVDDFLPWNCAAQLPSA